MLSFDPDVTEDAKTLEKKKSKKQWNHFNNIMVKFFQSLQSAGSCEAVQSTAPHVDNLSPAQLFCPLIWSLNTCQLENASDLQTEIGVVFF